MSIFFVSRNPINSCMKSLHSHDIESLLSITLASIVKESCIIFLWGILSEFYDVVKSIYYFLLYNFMSLCSVGRNPRNPYVKLLHSNAIESLVSMNLASILKESCIRFVWGMFSEFDDVVATIMMCYFVISCLYALWVKIQEIHMWNSCNSMLLIH